MIPKLRPSMQINEGIHFIRGFKVPFPDIHGWQLRELDDYNDILEKITSILLWQSPTEHEIAYITGMGLVQHGSDLELTMDPPWVDLTGELKYCSEIRWDSTYIQSITSKS